MTSAQEKKDFKLKLEGCLALQFRQNISTGRKMENEKYFPPKLIERNVVENELFKDITSTNIHENDLHSESDKNCTRSEVRKDSKLKWKRHYLSLQS